MSAAPKPKQAASRWNFLSQAVASVESGLDKILADEEDSTRKPKSQPVKPQENGHEVERASSDSKRNDDSSMANDRLQARLAQAMARKGVSRVTTPAPDSQPDSRAETPDVTAVKASEDDKSHAAVETPGDTQEAVQTKNLLMDTLQETEPPATAPTSLEQPSASRTSLASMRTSKVAEKASDVRLSLSERPSTDSRASNADVATKDVDQGASLLNIQLEHEKSLDVLRQEIDSYLERIDGLQRNLQILTQETINKTKQIKSDGESTTHEKQLAEKDQKIALLIEEGTKLTKGELQYRNMIKKLRAQAVTLNQDQNAIRTRAEKAEKATTVLEARAQKAEIESKQYSEQLKNLTKSAEDMTGVTKERNALQATLADVRSQLSRANARAENAESKAQSDKIEAERRRVAELQDDLSSVRVEKELAEDKLKTEITDLKASLVREKQQMRLMENEMLAEQAALESKLENLRLREEEASSNELGDSQAKLLRQIETLQSQYSSASSNWQGIESTLLGRITALEQERDEAVGREADLRRKLRDATTKAKNATKELDEVQHALHSLQDREADDSAEVRKATLKAEQIESENARLQKELADQKAAVEKELHRRLDEERTKWLATLPSTLQRIDSPVASIRRTQGGSFIDSLMSPVERPSSRRSSTQPFFEPPLHSRINSSVSLRPNGIIPETPSIHTPDDQDDFFVNVPATPASGTHAESTGRNINDVISVSTAAAGPSVQLVERLSTNVRRLESEKAAAKDEMARLSQQRDEARNEVVNLMREAEGKRITSEQITQLEKQQKDLQAKYQATLELLGERTEQVEELKADIADVKQMYRHLADTMGR